MKTGTQPSEHDLMLWRTFEEWYPGWVHHVEKWENHDEKSIKVTMKNDGYMTSGWIYIFGKELDKENWLLNRIYPPREPKSA